MATLRVLMVSGVEELKILQTILLLVSVTEVVQGKDLTKVTAYITRTYMCPQIISIIRHVVFIACATFLFLPESSFVDIYLYVLNISCEIHQIVS